MSGPREGGVTGETARESIWVLFCEEMIVIAVFQQFCSLCSVRLMERSAEKTGGRQTCNFDRLHHCFQCRCEVCLSWCADYIIHMTSVRAVTVTMIQYVDALLKITIGLWGCVIQSSVSCRLKRCWGFSCGLFLLCNHQNLLPFPVFLTENVPFKSTKTNPFQQRHHLSLPCFCSDRKQTLDLLAQLC